MNKGERLVFLAAVAFSAAVWFVVLYCLIIR